MPQDPAEIQRQIEATRAQLATTVDQIADRVSPKRVVAKGQEGAKQKVGQVQAFYGVGTAQPRWERVGATAAAVLVLAWLRRRRKAHRDS